MQYLAFVLTIASVSLAEGYYSKYYKKCKLVDREVTDMSELELEVISEYKADYHFLELTNTTLPLNYQPLQLIYDEFIDSGGSGEVYRIENSVTNKIKVLKRFFKENKLEFEQ
jgi:hypothetical protein